MKRNKKRRKADRAKKIRELGIRSKEDVWFENYEVVKRCFEEGIVLDTKHRRWLQRQKKADISEDKRELIKGLKKYWSPESKVRKITALDSFFVFFFYMIYNYTYIMYTHTIVEFSIFQIYTEFKVRKTGYLDSVKWGNASL